MAIPDGPEAERISALRRRLGAAPAATLANFAWFAARRGAHASALEAAREAVALPGAPRVAWHSLERLVTGRSDGLLLAPGEAAPQAPAESSSASSLAAAVAAHREGALAVAETCYLAAAPNPALSAAVADGLAVLHEQRQERDAADAAWARARATGAPRAAHNQALAAIRRGTLAPARDLLATAVRQSPSPDPTLWFLAGYAALLDGDPNDALRALEVAVALDPDLARAHFTLGLVHDRLGHASAALSATRRGLLLSPWYLPQVWLLTPAPGGPAVELPAGNDGHAGHSGTDDVLLALGRSLLETAHLGESLAVFDQVLVRDPAQPAALFHRGVVLAKLRRYDEALADWEEVGRSDPDGTLGTLSRRHARSARQLAALFATRAS